ncbi:hypothetical protein [Moellerella wisconsensis]|uniref:Uncharacterized protein n=2 Tax=Moellerella wisconsensis TaxID=158849 RepID=A0A9Q8Q4S7_9GAMM|nr:hypothetical protein [Moellerella wisconsensis]KLN96400.1 hypothetical protein VK86_10250 [Moellerella wisconsensis]UNH32156.1 hypothetical protein MNY72_07710 [Moellerella wisconsensis]UNH40306.1 hypothetical protein MNY70_07735 [Moellerella wisconsensis]UNH43844.1 hypothetical protein MNY66_07750 [Moellerella wisconsensis]
MDWPSDEMNEISCLALTASRSNAEPHIAFSYPPFYPVNTIGAAHYSFFSQYNHWLNHSLITATLPF